MAIVPPSGLPRFYAAEPTREREVALYIDGKYVARGPCSHAERPARYGFDGWNEVVSPDRLTFELDQNSWGMDTPERHDRPFMCWGLGTMSAVEFLAWWQQVSR